MARRSAGQLAKRFFVLLAGAVAASGNPEERKAGPRPPGGPVSGWYSARPETLDQECATWINEYTAFWKAKLGDLKSYLESEAGPQRVRRGRTSSGGSEA